MPVTSIGIRHSSLKAVERMTYILRNGLRNRLPLAVKNTLVIYDVIILGSGPAGLTAAIYASRSFLKTAVLTGYQPLGQLTTTTMVENFPGFPEGVMGPDLMNQMLAQAKKFNTTIVADEATSIILRSETTKDPLTKENTLFIINGTYHAKSIIIATGASHKKLDIPTEEKFAGKGVSYCATCDAFFFRDKIVGVVGGGDTAMEEASFISKFAKKVYLIHRRNEFRASKIMIERVLKNQKIEIIYNRTVKELSGIDKLQKAVLQSTVAESDMELPLDGLFVAIGLKPNTDFLKGKVNLDEKGYIIGTEKFKHMTNVPGVFFAGDCADSIYRQAVTAAGDGCAAALEVDKYLQENGQS